MSTTRLTKSEYTSFAWTLEAQAWRSSPVAAREGLAGRARDMHSSPRNPVTSGHEDQPGVRGIAEEAS